MHEKNKLSKRLAKKSFPTKARVLSSKVLFQKIWLYTTKSLHRLRLFAEHNFGVVVIFICFFIFGVVIGVYRYSTYLDGFDFSVFYQAIWKYANLHYPDSTIRGVNHIDGDHFHPLIALFGPIYAIFSSPYTLVVLQSFFVGISVFPLYLFAKKALEGKINAILATALYALSGGLQWMLYFDFHEILFAVPAISWSMLFIAERKWTPLLVCVAILALTKEEMFIYIFSIGILLLITRWNIKLGSILSFSGVVGFFILNQVIMPYLAGPRSYRYWSYDTYGSSVSDALKNSIAHPLATLKLVTQDIVNSDAKVTLSYWFRPFLYIMPLLSPYIVLAIPLMLTRFLSSHTSYSVHVFHYGATIAPIIAFAAIDTYSRLQTTMRIQRWFKPQSIRSLLTLLLVIGIMLNVDMSNKLSSPSGFLEQVVKNNVSSHTEKIYSHEQKVQKIVGRESSVIAPDIIAAHFANRDNIYILRKLDSWDNYYDNIINPVPIRLADYLIININLPLPDSGGVVKENQKYIPRYRAEISKRGFKEVYHDNTGWIVYKNVRK